MRFRADNLRDLWRGTRSFPTVAVSIVMAMGIMVGGAFQQVRFLREDVGPEVTAIGVLILLVLFASYIRDAVRGVFFERHFGHPIASFAAGTWVAGTSVAIVTILAELPELRELAKLLFCIDLFILPAYLVLIIRNYGQLWLAVFARRQVDRIVEVHGVLLLACVATQSIVVAGSALLGRTFPQALYLGLIVLGTLLYLFGLVFIVTRYVGHRTSNLADHWNNANCILHGAMSITGLASVKSGVVAPNVVAAIWLYVLAMFVLVEAVEVMRAVQRVRRYGWNRGIFKYSIGQWARNFTFGMLLDFTMNFSLNGSVLAGSSFWQTVRSVILSGGKYVVIALFLIEVLLYIKQLTFDRVPGKREGARE